MSDKPSKSAEKRRHLALQALGEKLIQLPENKLGQLPLDDDLADAIRTAAGMRTRGALRRQRQLIGKLMARADGDAIRAAYDRVTLPERVDKHRFRTAEQWRDRLLRDDESALQAIGEVPGIDTDALQVLLDEYRAASADGTRRRIAKRLFRAIHEQLGNQLHAGHGTG